jgi:hypothetical protein
MRSNEVSRLAGRWAALESCEANPARHGVATLGQRYLFAETS